MGNNNSSAGENQIVNPVTHNSSFYVKGSNAKKAELLGFASRDTEQFSFSQKINRGATVLYKNKGPSKVVNDQVEFIERESNQVIDIKNDPDIVMSNRNKFNTIEDYRVDTKSMSNHNKFGKQSMISTKGNEFLKNSVAELLGKVNQVQKTSLNDSHIKYKNDLNSSFVENELEISSQEIYQSFSDLKDKHIKIKKNKRQLISSKGSMKNLRGSLLHEQQCSEDIKKSQLDRIGVIISDPNLNNIISNRLSVEEIEERHNHTIEFDNRKVIRREDEVRTSSSTDSIKEDNISTISKISIGNQSFISQAASVSNGTNSRIYSGSNVDILRKNYICTLIQNKIWVPGTKKNSFNSIIIFDWDDTLMCTSFLTPHGVFEEDVELSDDDHESIAKLEFCVLRLLTMCIDSMADIYIITNSQEGWIEYSTERFLPSIKKLLPKIKIISARAQYEKVFPNDSKRWKIEAYLSIRSRYQDVSTNLINMGDSLYDLEAGSFLAKQFKECYLKSVKFRECPTILEMIKQLNLIISQFNLVFKTVKNLSIRVEKK